MYPNKMKIVVLCCAIVMLVNLYSVHSSSLENGLLIVTVATDETDGFLRYVRSTKKYDLDLKVYGLGEAWQGGDVANSAGGGYKINLLKAGLTEYAGRDDLIIMFTDSYDVVFTNGASEILEKFRKMDARVVFAAEGFCWPDKSLAEKYPVVTANEKRFLNSGGFMGYAKDIYEITHYRSVANTDDDQLYYTNIFLDPELREKWKIKLDTRAEIFQNLNGALGELTLKFKGSTSYIYNVISGTTPVVFHGNGPVKVEFNRMANYLSDGWTTNAGCQSCKDDVINLKQFMEDDFPTVMIGVFVEKKTPFITEFFQKVASLNYPKQKIDLLLHNSLELHKEATQVFVNTVADSYRSINVLHPSDKMSEINARNWAIEECRKKACQYFFSVDSDAHLDNGMTLQLLIEQNRSVIAPLIARTGKLWTNFWGSLGTNGFYARSEDYVDIVEGRKIGLWNVPYISSMYLIQGHIVSKLTNPYTALDVDPDMALCRYLRNKGIFMYVSNLHFFGHLVDSENFDTSHKHNELWDIFNNPHDWEKRYIHENYSKSLEEGAVISQPCPDVFWFPVVTDTFGDHLIEEMELFGQWSGGKNEDPRLAGGYENVPTDDIHLKQVDLERQWLHFLKVYVSPLQQKVFLGYYHDPPAALLNFVVKYDINRQRSLRPHHDSSTFTVNIALNSLGVDFEGGGCRFLRYNCSITATKKGWMLMHPGRLTHYHEGLPITKGTRYIMVSFVDP